MKYQQVTENERYLIGYLRTNGYSLHRISKELGRHRSTITREVRRNTSSDTFYKPLIAHRLAIDRRRQSRRNSRFNEGNWALVENYIQEDWAPEIVSLWLRNKGTLFISHETIYRRIWKDKEMGGTLYCHLRQNPKLRRKRYRGDDHRGVLRGKRSIDERPDGAKNRSELGHFEIDLVHGKTGQECIMTLVDRKSRYLIIRKLVSKKVRDVNRILIPIIRKYGIKTITADNGVEFHGYKRVEKRTSVLFYFAAPHHSWERGTVENTNGLIRQYIPKWETMTGLRQWLCNEIARKLNRRPKKVLNLKTPEESHYDLVA